MDQYRAKRTKKGQNEEKPKQAIALSYAPGYSQRQGGFGRKNH